MNAQPQPQTLSDYLQIKYVDRTTAQTKKNVDFSFSCSYNGLFLYMYSVGHCRIGAIDIGFSQSVSASKVFIMN